MKSILLAIFAVAVPLGAQPRQFVSNYDGSKLFFTSPYMRPNGAAANMRGFINVIDNGQFRISRQNENELLDPDISRDGTVITFRAGSMYIGTSRIEGLPGGSTLETEQAIRLSSNGRFAVRFDHTENAYRWYLDSRRITWLGKTSPTYRFGGYPFPRNARLIADDGTAVLTMGTEVRLYPKNSTDEVYIKLIENCMWPGIDEAATTVVCTQTDRWILRDLSANRESVLPGGFPVMSSNGRRILTRNAQEAWLLDRDLDTYQRVASPPGYWDHTLSGDGNTAWFLSSEGIFRLYLPGNRLELMVRFPVTIPPQRNPISAVPGSLYSIYIPGMPGVSSRQASAPLPTMLESFVVRIEGKPAPLQAVLPRFPENGEPWIELRFQIPWITPLDQGLRVWAERTDQVFSFDSLMAEVPYINLSSFYPLLLPNAQFMADAVHIEGNRAVTSDDPARLGESLRLLMTGLGPVSPAVADGQAGTSATIQRIRCHLWTDDDLIPLEVIGSTLAANIPGAYHVSVKLPVVIPPTREVWISCDSFPLPLPLAP